MSEEQKGVCHAKQHHDGSVPHPYTDKCQGWTPILKQEYKVTNSDAAAPKEAK